MCVCVRARVFVQGTTNFGNKEDTTVQTPELHPSIGLKSVQFILSNQ